jgi:hypothetical protein
LAKAGLLDPQKASLTTEKHEKRQKSARLDFSGAKGPVYLSSDYYVISEDQVPKKKNEALPACSKSAKPTSQSARPTAHAACPELTGLSNMAYCVKINLATISSYSDSSKSEYTS